jgi:hypothetical protein
VGKERQGGFVSNWAFDNDQALFTGAAFIGSRGRRSDVA